MNTSPMFFGTEEETLAVTKEINIYVKLTRLGT